MEYKNRFEFDSDVEYAKYFEELGLCKIVEGKFPHGGVKLVFYFFDSQDNRCKKEESTHCQILELDENGVCVFSLISGEP